MSNETSIVVAGAADMFMPVMHVAQAKQRRDAIVGFVQGMMVKDKDFGAVPGTDKPTLLKPGAEKLVSFFGYAPVFVPEHIVENFGDDGSEPLFFYRYRCELYRSGSLVGSGIGSCNSRESKYRYRNGERVCPECNKPAITRSKFPPRDNPNAEPGWYCYAKKGGCGAQFDATDKRIVGQIVGKVPNPDIADLVNTVDKMAQKRALIAATLIAVNASEFFTQDVEDMIVDAEYTVTRKEDAPPPPVGAATNGTTIGNNTANGSTNGQKANGNGGDMFKRYSAAKELAAKSGKFGKPGESGTAKHLDAAWGKMFAEYKAGDVANGETFLRAWAEYVDAHDMPSKPDTSDVPAMAVVAEMAA